MAWVTSSPTSSSAVKPRFSSPQALNCRVTRDLASSRAASSWGRSAGSRARAGRPPPPRTAGRPGPTAGRAAGRGGRLCRAPKTPPTSDHVPNRSLTELGQSVLDPRPHREAAGETRAANVSMFHAVDVGKQVEAIRSHLRNPRKPQLRSLLRQAPEPPRTPHDASSERCRPERVTEKTRSEPPSLLPAQRECAQSVKRASRSIAHPAHSGQTGLARPVAPAGSIPLTPEASWLLVPRATTPTPEWRHALQPTPPRQE